MGVVDGKVDGVVDREEGVGDGMGVVDGKVDGGSGGG